MIIGTKQQKEYQEVLCVRNNKACDEIMKGNLPEGRLMALLDEVAWVNECIGVVKTGNVPTELWECLNVMMSAQDTTAFVERVLDLEYEYLQEEVTEDLLRRAIFFGRMCEKNLSEADFTVQELQQLIELEKSLEGGHDE